MQKEEKLVKINCLLHGESAEKFLAIKDFKGIENNTEVIRSLIADFYRTNIRRAASEQV